MQAEELELLLNHQRVLHISSYLKITIKRDDFKKYYDSQ